MVATEFLESLAAAVTESEINGRAMSLENVSGLSGDKLIGMLQRFGRVVEQRQSGVYLEVGVFQGLSLCSVSAAAPALPCFGIDNFTQFDPDHRNRHMVEARILSHGISNAKIINADYEEALLNLQSYLDGRKVGVYFVDGPHDYRSQYLCLDFAKAHLADNCVIVVDDANYEHVRQANADWLKANPTFALLFDAYTECHPGNATAAQKSKQQAGWWNGVNVFVRDPGKVLVRRFPPENADRTVYLNEHILHALKDVHLAPEVVGAFGLPFLRMLAHTIWLKLRRGGNSGRNLQFAALNTYSASLTTSSLTPMSDSFTR